VETAVPMHPAVTGSTSKRDSADRAVLNTKQRYRSWSGIIRDDKLRSKISGYFAEIRQRIAVAHIRRYCILNLLIYMV